MAIPKAPILSNPTVAKVGVPGPDGVLVTAVTPKQALPPAQPPQPPPPPPQGAVGPTGPSGVAEQVVEEEELDPVIQALFGGGGSLAPDSPSAGPEERLLDRLQAVTPSSRAGQFLPSDVQERGEVQRGSAGAAFRAGFSEGLLGWMFSTEPQDQFGRDRAMAELTNYSAQNPFKSTLTQIAGGFVSDGPLEIALAFGTLGTGSAILMAGRASNRGVSAMRNMGAGVQKLRRAYRGAPGPALSKAGFQRLVNRGLFESSLGLTAGALSETLQQSLGKEGDLSDVVQRGLIDASLSSPFFEALRFAGRGLKMTNRAIGRRFAKSVADDTPGVRAADIEEGAVRALDTAEGAARMRSDDAQIRASRTVDSADQVPLSKREAKGVKQALADFRRNKNPKTLRRAISELLEGPDSSTRFQRADLVMDVLQRRARASGKNLKEYINTKRLLLRDQNSPSQIITNSNNIIGAPARATSVDEFLHEVGHLIYADLNDAHRSAFKRLTGVAPRRQLGREEYEKFADKFVEWIRTGKASTRPQRRMFQAVGDWLRGIYRKITRSPKDPTLEEIFQKLIPEDANRINEPFAVPTREREAIEARERAEAGLRELFAPPKKAAAKVRVDPLRERQKDEARKTQDRIVKEANEATERLDESIFIPRTSIARAFNTFKKKIGRLLYADNLGLVTFLRRFGPGGIKLAEGLERGVTNASRINVKIRNNMKSNAAKRNISVRDMAQVAGNKDKTKVTLETRAVEVEGKNKKEIIKDQEVELTRGQLISLYLLSLDGFKSTKKADQVSNNSAQQALVASNAGFINPATGKKMALTKAQLAKIQAGELLTETEISIAKVIQSAYRDFRPEINKTGVKLVGRDLTDKGNDFYVPQVVEAGELQDDLSILESILGRGPDADELLNRGNLRARTGAAPLVLVDPLQQLNVYTNRMSNIVGKAESLIPIRMFLQQSGAPIEASFGKNVRRAMVQLTDINMGDTSSLGGFTEGSAATRLFSMIMIGRLSVNLGVAAKQVASAFTAQATGKVKASGLAMAEDASRLATNGSARKALVGEMSEHSPLMARRLIEEPQFIEIDDAVEGLGGVQLFHGKIPLEELGRLVKDRDIRLGDGWLDVVKRGTGLIKVMDESTLGAVWKAVKDDVISENTIDPNTSAFWREIDTRFTSIVLESQPTVDASARSINQMQRGIVKRLLTMYTTQTRKNAELTDKTISQYLNIDNPTAADKSDLMRVVMPLMAQTAYVAAVSTVYSMGVNQLIGALQSDTRRKRLDAQANTLAQEIFRNTMTNALGQIPISGKLTADFMNAVVGVKPFDQAVPVIDEFTDVTKGISERSLRNIMTGGMKLIGTPSLIRRPLVEGTSRLKK